MSSLIGLNTLCDGRLAFIVATREILLDEVFALLPADEIVVEIDDKVVPDTAVQQACLKLRREGYTFALGHFTVDDPRESLIELADFVKIDIKRNALSDLYKLVKRLSSGGRRLIAEKVETRDDFEFAKSLGFNLFEGFFFRTPEIKRARGAQSNRLVLLRLLAITSKPNLDWGEIEDVIKADPALYLRLLRHLNSAIFGLQNEIRSIKQALTFLGEEKVRRWCRLAGMLELSRNRPSDLSLAALVRARFGELIQNKENRFGADLFQIGILSLMDAILEIPMKDVLAGLSLDLESKTVLMENKGPLSPLYELMLKIEAADWPAVLRLCSRLGFNPQFVAQCHWDAMEWAQSVREQA